MPVGVLKESQVGLLARGSSGASDTAVQSLNLSCLTQQGGQALHLKHSI